MFNLGGDDKEKLKENMEEIREMVNQDQENQNQQNREQDQNSQKPDVQPQQTSKQKQEQPQPSPEPEDTEPSGNQDERSNRLEQALQEQQRETPQTGSDTREQSQNAGSRRNESRPRSGTRGRGGRGQGIEKLESGRGDGEAYLRVEDFNSVQDRIQEMKYITDELRDVMQDFEEGLQRSRDLESESGNMVDEFDSRRQRIESVLDQA